MGNVEKTGKIRLDLLKNDKLFYSIADSLLRKTLSKQYLQYAPLGFTPKLQENKAWEIRDTIILEGLPTPERERIYYTMQNIPGFFLQGIQRVSWIEKSVPLTEQDVDRKKGGEYKQISLPEEAEKNASVITLYAKEYTIKTLFHEVGHNAHALADDETILAWDRLLREAKFGGVSTYVQDIHNRKITGIPLENTGSENFAEVFAALFARRVSRKISVTLSIYVCLCYQ
jgi:hypothetical protein